MMIKYVKTLSTKRIRLLMVHMLTICKHCSSGRLSIVLYHKSVELYEYAMRTDIKAWMGSRKCRKTFSLRPADFSPFGTIFDDFPTRSDGSHCQCDNISSTVSRNLCRPRRNTLSRRRSGTHSAVSVVR